MVSLEKMNQEAPDLVKRYQTAKAQMEKQGITKAAVYLVVDVSGSMDDMFRRKGVQDLAERVLALSAAIDDDGIVPVIFFNHGVRDLRHITIGQHKGFMHNVRVEGGTRFLPAIDAVVSYHTDNEINAPGLVIFQTDGEEHWSDTEETRKRLMELSTMPIYWQFLGMGFEGGDSSYFNVLSEHAKACSNVGSIVDMTRVSRNLLGRERCVSSLSDDRLYQVISSNFAAWQATI